MKATLMLTHVLAWWCSAAYLLLEGEEGFQDADDGPGAVVWQGIEDLVTVGRAITHKATKQKGGVGG